MTGTPERFQASGAFPPNYRLFLGGSEDQLWVVLLFGERLESLGGGEAESVGRTRAAIADRAVGLASLYLLTSTPVEMVSYDPETQAFSAEFRLGSGTSLSLGSDAESRGHIGFRKRLSRFWAITTDCARPSTGTPSSETSSLSAFLEWSCRY